MARGLIARLTGGLAVRMVLLAGLTAILTLVIALTTYYAALYSGALTYDDRMPPKVRAEVEDLVLKGQRGSDRFFELYDFYAGDEMRAYDLKILALIGALATLAGGSVAFVFARRISQPITEVGRAAALVAAGDRSARVDAPRATGETADLVAQFNAMATALERYERERNVLTAGVAHELRTPLTVLRGRLHASQDGLIAADGDETARLIRQVDQLTRIVDDLRTLAHADAGALVIEPQATDLSALARTVAQDLSAQSADRALTVTVEGAAVVALCDPNRMTQIMTNLLTNAIKHSPTGGRVGVSLSSVGMTGAVAVTDEGPGFTPSDTERLFIPFWRGATAKQQPGSGMGLALASRLSEAQGGTLSAANRSDRSGATFTVTLPLASMPKATLRSRAPRASS